MSPRRSRTAVLVGAAIALALHGAPLGAQAATPAPPAPGAAGAAASASTPARTGLRPFSLDRAHSQINFVAEARLLSAQGWFDKWDADVQLDPAQLERGSVRFTIDAASINTRNERRDKHLRSADFFDVATHPTITFVSKGIARTGEKAGVITGDLTMRGVTKTIEVPVTMVFFDGGRGRFKGTFTLNRRDFGINYSSRLNPIEDMVEVQFQMAVIDRAPAEN